MASRHRGSCHGWIHPQEGQVAGIQELHSHNKGRVGDGKRLLDDLFSGGLLDFLLLNDEKRQAVGGQADSVGGHSAADHPRSILFSSPAKKAVDALSRDGGLTVHEHRAGAMPCLIATEDLR